MTINEILSSVKHLLSKQLTDKELAIVSEVLVFTKASIRAEVARKEAGYNRLRNADALHTYKAELLRKDIRALAIAKKQTKSLTALLSLQRAA